MNPYAKRTPTPSAPTPPRNAPNNRQQEQNARANNNNAPRYASDLLYGATSSNQQRQHSTQYPHRSRSVRSQRQFGTSIGVSLDDGMTDELRECMAAFTNDATKGAGKDNNASDISSESSDDEELFSFDVFGNK